MIHLTFDSVERQTISATLGLASAVLILPYLTVTLPNPNHNPKAIDLYNVAGLARAVQTRILGIKSLLDEAQVIQRARKEKVCAIDHTESSERECDG